MGCNLLARIKSIPNEESVKKSKKKKSNKKRSKFFNSFLDCLRFIGFILFLFIVILFYKLLHTGFLDLLLGFSLLLWSMFGFIKVNKLFNQKNFNAKLNMFIYVFSLISSILFLIYPVQLLVDDLDETTITVISSEYFPATDSIFSGGYVSLMDGDRELYKFYSEGPNSSLLTSDYMFVVLNLKYKSTIKGNIVFDFERMY